MCAAFLISASYDKQIRFWDVASGRTVRCLSFQDSQVNALMLLPNTTHLSVAGFGVIRVYDIGGANASVSGANQVPPLFSSYENQAAMNFTSLGAFPMRSNKGVLRLLGSSAEQSNSSFFNAMDFGATQRPVTDQTEDVSCILYATSEDGHIRFFNSSSPTALHMMCDISTGAAITCSAISPDRHTLLTGSQIGRVSVWHLPTVIAVATHELEQAVLQPFGTRPLQEVVFENDYTAIRSIAVEPLGRWAVVATNAGKLHFLRFVKDFNAEETEAETAEGSAEKPTHTAEERQSMASKVAPSSSFTTDSTGPKRAHGALQHAESIYRSALVSNELGNSGLKPSAAMGSSLSGTSGSFAAALVNSLGPGSLKGAGIAQQGVFSQNVTAKLNAKSPNSTPHKSPLLQQYVMEVFHSFQAHYKYILKVAISPNTDMVVTCCADYTVGRFVVPSYLQIDSVTRVDQSDEATTSSLSSDAHEATMASIHATDPNKGAPQTKKPTQTQQPPPASSLLQPMTPGDAGSSTAGDARTPQTSHESDGGKVLRAAAEEIETGGKSEGGQKSSANTMAEPLQPQPSQQDPTKGTIQKENTNVVCSNTTNNTNNNTNTQPSNNNNNNNNNNSNAPNGSKAARPARFHDASSLISSVIPSISAEGTTAAPPSSTIHFKTLKPLTGHTRWVWDCVFSDCGRYLFTASSDHNLRMWTGLLTDRVQSTSFVGHKKPVVCSILYYEKKRQQSV